jgi:hypothetical protein
MQNNENNRRSETRREDHQRQNINPDTRNLVIGRRVAKRAIPPDPRQLSFDFDALPSTAH